MGSINRTDLDLKLFWDFITPSWVSTVAAVTVGVCVPAGTIILTLFGSVVQQSLVGLHGVYRSTSFAATVDAIDGHFTHNATLGNIVLFTSWGMVGLVIFSIVQSVMRSVKRVDEQAMELNYVHANRHALMDEIYRRLAIRLVALGLALFTLHYYVYKVLPFTIGAAHTSAYDVGSFADWIHCLVAGMVCAIGVLVLDVLLHFVFMRPRLFGNNEIIT